MGTLPSKRDLRIDLFRGLALVVIYIDHIPYNRFSHLTLRNFGFTSAADIFVLLAGIAFALAYAPRLDARGIGLVTGMVGRRIVTIYAAHILVLLAALMLLVVVNRNAPLDLFVASPATWVDYSLPHAAAMSLVLQFQPPYFDILPLYLVLLAFALPLLFMARSHWGLALSASAALWLVAAVYGLNFPSVRSIEGWYFDPLSWQIVFATGLCIGLAGLGGGSIWKSRWLSALCILVIAVSFVLVFPCRHLGTDSSHCYLGSFSQFGGLVDRQTPWRFVNTLAWVYLIIRYVPRDARWLTRPAAQALTRMGRNSLAVFSIGTLLSLAARLALPGPDHSWLAQIAIFVTGTAVMALTAYLLDNMPRNMPLIPTRAKSV